MKVKREARIWRCVTATSVLYCLMPSIHTITFQMLIMFCFQDDVVLLLLLLQCQVRFPAG
jgi:hypothetical protein